MHRSRNNSSVQNSTQHWLNAPLPLTALPSRLVRNFCRDALVRRLLWRGNFTSTNDLKQQILNFINYAKRNGAIARRKFG
ncbi:MAG: hypothetical protein RMY34_04940 [Aulosira sp. DedQUE10]|nr:hypothetical protein [Aulosira sp. DedQUE10]